MTWSTGLPRGHNLPVQLVGQGLRESPHLVRELLAHGSGRVRGVEDRREVREELGSTLLVGIRGLHPGAQVTLDLVEGQLQQVPRIPASESRVVLARPGGGRVNTQRAASLGQEEDACSMAC